MCTVSFINVNGKTIITSNRDEKVLRPLAIKPKIYSINNKKVLFPKDPKAGGTWFAVDDNANVIVLLNGAEEKHIVTGNYRKSRGLIVLELISENAPLEMWQTIDLENIEPFTLVLFENQNLYQLRWNSVQKSTIALDKKQNHIWSSSTLYSKEIRGKRTSLFTAFLDTKPKVTREELFNFHRYTEADNPENGLVINRNNVMQTLSITQAVIEENKVNLFHHDLINKHDYSNSFIVI